MQLPSIHYLVYLIIIGTDSRKLDEWDVDSNGKISLLHCMDRSEVVHSDIKYTLYTKDNQYSGAKLTNENLEEIKKDFPITFIVHGWLQEGTQLPIMKMKDAYLSTRKINVITVDWSIFSKSLYYPKAFCTIPAIGILLGEFIHNVTTKLDIDLKNIQINGVSLGGHIAGYAGQEIQTITNGKKLGRINGLDTAGPGFEGLPSNKRLDKTDAHFVQGIHSNSHACGYGLPYGTVDFWVNFENGECGVKQAGCLFNPGVSLNLSNLSGLLPIVLCSHIRATLYFVESITSNDFLAVSCESCELFGAGRCKTQPSVVMGEMCPSIARGSKYLNINAQSPFAKGWSGL